MAIKNFWAFNPGETIFADKLLQKFKKQLDLYFPIKDTGIDLLAMTKDFKNYASFQIKESRYYENYGCTWHQETKKNFDKNKNRANFYVFVTYLPGYLSETKKKNRFVIHFVIIPIEELLERIKCKKADKNNTYHFCFSFEDNGKNLLEIGEKKSVREDKDKRWAFDYSKYLNAWDLIAKKLRLPIVDF